MLPLPGVNGFLKRPIDLQTSPAIDNERIGKLLKPGESNYSARRRFLVGIYPLDLASRQLALKINVNPKGLDTVDVRLASALRLDVGRASVINGQPLPVCTN